MATPEAIASVHVHARSEEWGMRLYRNNSGMLYNEAGVPVRFGLGNDSAKVNKLFKSGDFIGWYPLTITPDMVGQTVAVFVNIEVKALGFKVKDVYNKNSREFAQDKFNKLVTDNGGIAGFATNWEDVDAIVNGFYQKVRSNG